MGDDIDDLIEQLGELDSEERRELSRRMQADWARRIGDAQRAYLERLEEENLVGGGGSVFQPIPGEEEEWIEYCREHPNDPMCLLGAPAVGDRLSDFLDIREEYISHLEEEGLLDIEAASPGGGFEPVARSRGDPSPQPSLGGGGSPVGLTPLPDPWPWPPEWPPWPWPWPGPGPRPGPWPYADNGDPVPLPMDRMRRGTAIDPRRSTPGSGAALSREGLTFPPDTWPVPPWPWPWPWPGPRPDPFPFGGDPIPFPANPGQRRW
ncbi:hypothetical protein [Haloplanus aerogenes]|uniref:Uncharacterized protein n=1 Tax=Haloplanus aerogenes TaxID=660522 RepID=A0A3M0CZ91_9EURY|nr:hypothetical protein [Haloplanus aerogenes]AZH25142.1 hypothetical protein DU502_07025 [Haloplanus aerogenes]RMB13630.1 hypothetical protein ATH50_2069 [Haloplanus aerogenes]